jgi:hypothetical protein
MANRIRAIDLNFISILSGPHGGVAEFHLSSIMRQLANAAEGRRSVAVLDGVELCVSDLHSFMIDNALSVKSVEFILAMLRSRDRKIRSWHKDENDESDGLYTPLKRDVFLSLSFENLVLSDDNFTTIKSSISTEEAIDWSQIGRIFWMAGIADGTECVFHLDLSRQKQIFFVCGVAEIDIELFAVHVEAVNRFIFWCNLDPNPTPWTLSPHPNTAFEHRLNELDGNMYGIVIMYFLTVRCPVVFRRDDIKHMRRKFPAWCLTTELPL